MLQSLFGTLFRRISNLMSPKTSPITQSPSSSSPAPLPKPSSSESLPSESNSTVSNVSGPTHLAWGAHPNVTPEFRAKVIGMSQTLRTEPDWLMACMAFETGPKARFSPTAKNMAGSGATGLIQFMPSTLKGMGYTVEQAEAMTTPKQLDLVFAYMLPYTGRLNSLSDVYLAILWPAAVGKPEDFILWTKALKGETYRQNAGLDGNTDGTITKAEAAAKVQATLVEGMRPGNLWVSP